MELTLKEIDECKKAIDKNIAFHKVRVEAIEASSDKDAKKQELESVRLIPIDSNCQYYSIFYYRNPNSRTENYHKSERCRSFKDVKLGCSVSCDWVRVTNRYNCQ